MNTKLGKRKKTITGTLTINKLIINRIASELIKVIALPANNKKIGLLFFKFR